MRRCVQWKNSSMLLRMTLACRHQSSNYNWVVGHTGGPLSPMSDTSNGDMVIQKRPSSLLTALDLAQFFLYRIGRYLPLHRTTHRSRSLSFCAMQPSTKKNMTVPRTSRNTPLLEGRAFAYPGPLGGPGRSRLTKGHSLILQDEGIKFLDRSQCSCC